MKWLKDLREELDRVRVDRRSIGWFVAILAALAYLSAYRLRGEGALPSALTVFATLALAVWAVRWQALAPAYRVIMGAALAVGSVVTRVFLVLVWCLLIMPIGLILRATGKDLMEGKIDPDAATYWRPVAPRMEGSFEKKF